jgi:hypothetical protein
LSRALLLLVLALAAGGCSFTSALQDYCAETELCACQGDDCCIKSTNSCEEGLCCGRLVCSVDPGGNGTCVQGPDQPFLAFEPPNVDFGTFDVDGLDPAPFQVVTVTNVGTLPTAPLQRRLSGAVSDLSVQEDTCIDRALAPGEACTLLIAVTPTALGVKQMRFAYFEAPDVDTTGEASVLLTQ